MRRLRSVTCVGLLSLIQPPALLHAQESSIAPANTMQEPIISVKRYALIIGNSQYRNVPSLKNTKNDANAMASKLQKLGYDVLYRTDLDRRDMNETVSTFLARVEVGSEALIYYAGHGVELNGSNYLLPTDIPALSPDQERMLRTEGVNLTDLLLDLESRSARVSLVILDACRDNPFREIGGVATRSLGSTRGLGRVEPPRGTFVIFSAGVGEQAIDNLGSEDTNPNGLFTRKLLTLIDQDGLEIRPLVQRLRAEVRQAALIGAGRSQTPSYYDQLIGEFYFHFKSNQLGGYSDNSCDRLVDLSADSVSLLKSDLTSSLQACETASAQFPNEIRYVRQLQAVQELRVAKQAISSNQINFANVYLTLYPNGRFVGNIKAHVATLSEALWLKPAPDQPVKIMTPVFPEPTVVPPIDIGRVLQVELKRVGCDPDTVDGTWGRSSTQAMSSYNRITGAKFEAAKPTLEAVEAIRRQSDRICPLIPPKIEVARPTRKLQHKALKPTPLVVRQTPKQKKIATADTGVRRRSSCIPFNGVMVCD